jgi:methanogenic corrinoid protein MtbC1
MPQRTAGGHRLYSEQDVEIIKWLQARQNDGLSISRAVEMWKDKTAQGQDPLAGSLQFNGQSASQSRASTLALAKTGIDELRSQWLSACLNFNESAAEQALNQAFALYPVEFVCTEVLQRGLVDVGALWYQDRASVQQEHFTSALAQRRLNALFQASPLPTRPQSIIVGCPANEWHTFTPLLMALFLRRRGFNVIYLGANVPPDHFAETVETVNAHLVVLAAQQLISAASLQQAAALIAGHGVPVAFGGRIFSLHADLARRIAGHSLGSSMDGAVEVAESLLTTRPAAPRIIPATDEYAASLKAFGAQRALIEASLKEQDGLKAPGTEYFPDAHRFMGDNILAALQLGNLTYLDAEMDWLKVLIRDHDLPESLLAGYLKAYSQAVDQHLAGRVPPLAQWFERQIQVYQN